MTPPVNRRADAISYERVPDSIIAPSAAPRVSVEAARHAGYVDVPLASIASTTDLSTIGTNRRPDADASPYEVAPQGLRAPMRSDNGGYASAGVVAALAASRAYQKGPASLVPNAGARQRLASMAGPLSTAALLAVINLHAHDGSLTASDDASDAAVLETLPLPALVDLLWAAFDSHAMQSTRGIFRIVLLALSLPRLASRLPHVLLGEKTRCAVEISAKCRAIEPLVAIVGIAAQQDHFARVVDVLSSASVLSFASERIVGVTFRALKVESPRLFAEVWLKLGGDIRKRIQQLIEAHVKVPYDRSLKPLLCFDDEQQPNDAARKQHSAPPQLLRRAPSLQLTHEHVKLLTHVSHFSPQQLSAALRSHVLAESGTHSDDDDDDDDDNAVVNPYDDKPPSLGALRRASVLDLALLDVDTSSSSSDPYTPISYNLALRANDVWTAGQVRAAVGGSGSTLDADESEAMRAQVRELRARLRKELQVVSVEALSAMPSPAPLTRIFQLHVVDTLVDVGAFVGRLREASVRGGAQFARTCGDALRALSESDLDAIVGALEPNDAKWILEMAKKR
jgi:hypothetical protein